jgi:TPR repeat protein
MLRRGGWILFVGFGVGLFGCGGGAVGEAVRPKEPTTASVIGDDAAQCTKVSPDGQPWIVDWKDEHRGDLEIAMKSGVAVVAYDCSGIKLLRDCKIPGEYGFAAYDEPKRSNFDLSSSDDLAASVPLSAASMSAELKRGLTLTLAYAMVGQKGTTVKRVSKRDLQGECAGATHFVRGAFVGAFKLATASQGSVAGSANVLGAGSSGSSQSARKMDRSEGDVSACKSPAAGETAPPGCRALVRLMLGPVATEAAAEADQENVIASADGTSQPTNEAASGKEHAAGKDELTKQENPCSQGFVLTKEGKCTRPQLAKAYQCNPKDVKDCEKQCNAGDAASCYAAGNYARLAPGMSQPERLSSAEAFFKRGCDAGHAASCAGQGHTLRSRQDALSKAAEIERLYTKGCDGGDANSCVSLAGYLESVQRRAPASVSSDRIVQTKRRACDLGAGFICGEVGTAYLEGKLVARNIDLGLNTLSRACDAGNAQTCLLLASALRGKVAGVPSDLPRAKAVLERQCTKSPRSFSSNACDELGTMYRKGDGVARSLEQARKYFENACLPNNGNTPGCIHLAEMYEAGEGGAKNPAFALELYQKHCTTGGKTAGCVPAARINESGANGVTRNPKKAAELYTLACAPSSGFRSSGSVFPWAASPEQMTLSCVKAAPLLRTIDKAQAKEVYAKLCRFKKTPTACGEYKKLGGDPSQLPAGFSEGPPRPPAAGPSKSLPPPPPPPRPLSQLNK